MERVLQWLDECEDLAFCLPLLWPRLRVWLLVALIAAALTLPT
jgi:hypothetical protein